MLSFQKTNLLQGHLSPKSGFKNTYVCMLLLYGRKATATQTLQEQFFFFTKPVEQILARIDAQKVVLTILKINSGFGYNSLLFISCIVYLRKSDNAPQSYLKIGANYYNYESI